MAVSKIYANTLAQLASNKLDDERLRRVVEAPDVATALKMLGDYGYTVEANMSVDGFVVEQTNALIEFVEENAASRGTADALTAPFVYNNAKLAYKSRFTAVPDDGYYRTTLDTSLVAGGDYSNCDGDLSAALTALDEAEETRPQEIDLAVTRAMYKHILRVCGGAAKRYFRAEIDLKNILSAARMRRLKISRDEFIVGGRIKQGVLSESVTADSFSECFVGTPYADAAERAEERDFADLGAFEREADDFLCLMTDRLCVNMTSDEPFMNYYARTRTELKTVKTALVCIKTNARDIFYSRIPDIYR